MAIVPAGSVVGEGPFFAPSAQRHRQAAAASKLWALTALRFTELTNRQPAICPGVGDGGGRGHGQTPGKPPPPCCGDLTPGG